MIQNEFDTKSDVIVTKVLTQMTKYVQLHARSFLSIPSSKLCTLLSSPAKTQAIKRTAQRIAHTCAWGALIFNYMRTNLDFQPLLNKNPKLAEKLFAFLKEKKIKEKCEKSGWAMYMYKRSPVQKLRYPHVTRFAVPSIFQN